MANLTTNVKIVSNALTSDNILVDLSDQFTVQVGGVMTVQVNAVTSGAADTILLNTNYETPAYVWLRNMENTSTDNYITINCGTETSFMVLKPGEFAWFPWNTSADIKAFGVNVDQILEYGCFS